MGINFSSSALQNSGGFPGALGKKQEWARIAEHGGGPDHTKGWGRVMSAGRQGCLLKHGVKLVMWHWSFQPPSIQQNSGQDMLRVQTTVVVLNHVEGENTCFGVVTSIPWC